MSVKICRRCGDRMAFVDRRCPRCRRIEPVAYFTLTAGFIFANVFFGILLAHIMAG